MSTEFVRSIKVVQDKENNEYYAEITSASSNLTDYRGRRIYDSCKCFKGRGMTKEEVEKEILYNFFCREIKGGQSKYNKIMRVTGYFWVEKNPKLHHYYKAEKVLGDIRRKFMDYENEYYRTYGHGSHKDRDKQDLIPNQKELMHNINRLDKRLVAVADRQKQVLCDTLYEIMNDFHYGKTAPFKVTIKSNPGCYYLNRIRKNNAGDETIEVNFNKNYATSFTDAFLYDRITKGDLSANWMIVKD